jgi:hypothetical protein
MHLPKIDVDVKLKMLILKCTVGVLTSFVIGTIIKEEIKVLDDAEEKLIERKRQKEEAAQEISS